MPRSVLDEQHIHPAIRTRTELVIHLETFPAVHLGHQPLKTLPVHHPQRL